MSYWHFGRKPDGEEAKKPMPVSKVRVNGLPESAWITF
jgi:hypothetical protein